ncbi:MAG: nucleotide exchange factor GrpE [bacterium]
MSDADQFPPEVITPQGSIVADDAESVSADDAGMSQQLEDQKEKYLRLAAEYDNYRRRTVKERQEAQVRGQADMLRGLIDPLDDIGRFAHVDPATTDTQTLVDGVAMVEKKLAKTLAGHGLEIINPDGHPFDPALHEAVMSEPAATPEEDHLVSRTFQVGYLFNGQLLRAARVVVKQWNG